MDKLINVSKKFNRIEVYTSMETIGSDAEYIRDGLNWEVWSNNVHRVLTEGNFKQLHCMMTINALCIAKLNQLLDFIVRLRVKHPRALLMSFNILRFPSFQSLTVLPRWYRDERANLLERWLEKNAKALEEFEREGLKRTIEYIRAVDEGHSHTSSLESRQQDFKSFFTQYDRRRGKDFISTFPTLAEWYTNLTVPKDGANSPMHMSSGNSNVLTLEFQRELKERQSKGTLTDSSSTDNSHKEEENKRR